MSNIAIIPARMGSSRFFGKPMAKILNIPMIGHVYYRVKMASNLDQVYVATCDLVIFNYIESIGGKAIMTGNHHERCTDRCTEALEKIESQENVKVNIMVMVQGDEAMVQPKMIEESLQAIIEDSNIQVVNLFSPILTKKEFEDPNEVKVVMNQNNDALYFSREAIPSIKKIDQQNPPFRQVCIIPFQRNFLFKFNQLKPTPLEIQESVDMMRVLEHGYQVKMVLTKFQSKAVDTIEDLKQVEKLMTNDPLIKLYQ
ncbi:MAG: 3-deoxy-manno-octulosonate cytidylyltransferase [Candidatus Cloacimonadota bacterium]|nr:MAG: 3-deoxy-manno-octulosonate cytidylyltransferase [Candidatus Cloacimonadota bacterium]